MMSPFETAGFWHIPDDPSHKVAGILRYSPGEGLRLSLTGSFARVGAPVGARTYPIIHGVVHDSPCGNAFSLVNCFQSGLSVQMPGFATEEVFANQAYAGDFLLEEKDLNFDGAALRLSGLDSWIGTTGISRSVSATNDERELGVRYHHPDAIPLSTERGILKIGFAWSESHSHRSYSLREEVGLKIKNIGRLSCKALLRQYVGPLRDFFSLAIDEPCSLIAVTLYNDNLKLAHDDRPAPIRYLACPLGEFKQDQKERLAHDMLFVYDDIRDSVPQIVERWLEFSDTFKAFCSSYFGLLYAPEAFVEARFLTLLESMVLFFQEADTADDLAHTALEEATRVLQDHGGERNRPWLTDAMPSVDEVAFPWRIRAALEMHRAVMEPLVGTDFDQFVDDILLMRRYCRYRDAALLESIAHGADIHWLTEKLRVLIKLLLVTWLGIPLDLAHRLIRRNRTYSHLLTLNSSG